MTRKNNAQQYKKTLLITGGAGFIGSNYLNKYAPLRPHDRFVVIDALTKAGSRKNIQIWNLPNFVFIKGDIRNFKTLETVFKKFHPSGVIHFAAETHVDRSIENPNIFAETNVLGTLNLLSCAVAYGVSRFLHISTDEVYGSLTRREEPFTESTILKPNSPYSASKAAAEHFVRSYRETFGLNTLITRCSNNYGPYQDKTKFIPVCILKLLTNQKIPLYGNGLNVRDWIYVEDHVDALDLVFRKGKAGEIYNIGGNQELKNIEVIKKLLRLIDKDEKLISYVKDRKGHDFRYALDTKKIEKELGFRPKINFSVGIRRTLEYYKKLS